MEPKAIIAALPWLRRGWRMLPPQARPLVFLAAAAVAVFYVVSGSRDLAELRGRDGEAPDRTTGPRA